jgi:hypothetical protein
MLYLICTVSRSSSFPLLPIIFLSLWMYLLLFSLTPDMITPTAAALYAVSLFHDTGAMEHKLQYLCIHRFHPRFTGGASIKWTTCLEMFKLAGTLLPQEISLLWLQYASRTMDQGPTSFFSTIQHAVMNSCMSWMIILVKMYFSEYFWNTVIMWQLHSVRFPSA